MKKLIPSLFLTVLFPLLITAQSSEPCTDFLKFGVYDKYQTFSSELQYKQIKEFFKSFQFSTKQQAESKANEIGLDIVDILGLSFDGKSSTTNFEQWQQQLINSSYQEAVNAGLKIEKIEKISDNIKKIVEACLSQKGVHAYIVPSADPKNFSFTIDFIPYNSREATAKGTFSITPSSVAASAMPRGMVGQPVEIGPQGASISLTRLPTETVTITYNTDQGSGSIHYDAVVTPKPVVSFRAEDEQIPYGKSTKLRWNAENAQRVELDGEQVNLSGNLTVSPESTSSYRLRVISLDGQSLSYRVTVNVAPKPPKLTAAKVHFNTTNDDKDDNTNVTVNIIFGGNTIATISNKFGYFPDNTPSGWKDLKIIDEVKKENLIGGSSIQLIEGPVGHDEWHFNWSLELTFSDGSKKQYDWTGGDVDHDRTTITKSL